MRRYLLSIPLLTAFIVTPLMAHAEDEPTPASAAMVAQMQLQINQLHDELRMMRGQLEQSQYQSRVTADALKKYEMDTDSRVQALEQRPVAAMPAPVAAPAPAAVPHSASNFSPDAGANGADEMTPVPEAPAPATYQKAGKEAKGEAAVTGKDFPDANAHYNYAFKLLNDKKFAEAAASFDAFVKKYPSDPLTGNAYYWLGESYYARTDYTRASEGFRKGFEVAPEGQKAADNLFKLGLSLAQVKRVPEACIVLSQVSAKYAQSNARTAARAEAERQTLQCK